MLGQVWLATSKNKMPNYLIGLKRGQIENSWKSGEFGQQQMDKIVFRSVLNFSSCRLDNFNIDLRMSVHLLVLILIFFKEIVETTK